MHITKKRSVLRLIRAFDAVVILALVFQPMAPISLFAQEADPVVSAIEKSSLDKEPAALDEEPDDAPAVEEATDTVETFEEDTARQPDEENPAPVTQEEELPADENFSGNQKETEIVPDADPVSVPVEYETEDGRVEAEGEAFIEKAVSETSELGSWHDVSATLGTVSIPGSIMATVNGVTHADVDPGATFVATLTGGTPNKLHSVKWKFGSGDWSSCAELSGTGTVNVTAPVAPGNYPVTFYAYSGSDCRGGSGAENINTTSITVKIIWNSSLPKACGFDIALVFDTSRSINPNELALMKEAMRGFVKSLAGTPTRFSVTTFSKDASILRSFTGDTDDIVAAIDYSITTTGAGTNWKEGIKMAHSTFDGPGSRPTHPDMIIFASDGNPNLPSPNAINAAVLHANMAKSEGIRILSIGIGNDNLNVANLALISGPNIDTTGDITGSDVVTTDFTKLSATLRSLAEASCGGTITVNKFIGDTEHPADAGWTFDVAGKTQITDADGRTSPVRVNPGTYSVFETGMPSGYAFGSASCRKNGQAVGQSVANGVDAVSVGSDDIVTCTFINNEQRQWLTLFKRVINGDSGTAAPNDFTLKANDISFSPGETKTIPAGTYALSESGPSGYTASDWSCVGSGTLVGSGLTLRAGESARCEITNTANPATLRICKFDDLDGNGLRDEDEEMLAGWTMNVTQGTEPIRSGMTQENGCITFGDLSAGTYTVTETPEEGWTNTKPLSQPVTLSLGEEEEILFGNQRLGSIIVHKDVVGPNGQALVDTSKEFVVALSGAVDGMLTLTDGGEKAWNGLVAGIYTVAEVSIPSGYELVSVTPDANSGAVGAQVTVRPGRTTHVFVVNRANAENDPVVVPETGKITVEKRTKNAGSDQIFSFIPSYSGNFLLSNGGFRVSDSLAPGFYSVREAELYGWDLSALACIDRAGVSTVSVDKNGMTAGIQLAAGGDVLCTFTNKDTKRSDDPWDGNGGKGGNGGRGAAGGGLSVATALAAGSVVISGAVAGGAAETVSEDVPVEETELGIVEGVSDCVGGWPLWAWILIIIAHTAVSTLKRVIRKPVIQKWGIPIQLGSAMFALAVWYLFDTCREYWPNVPIAIVFVSIASLFLFRHWKK